MKIGIFDSGLGGLFVLKSLLKSKVMSKYDYAFLADTKNLPYGNKSQEEIYKLAVKAIEYLFKQDCALVIVACNTASSQALRKIQQEYLPKSKYKDRKVLGVIRPTVEVISQSSKKVGLIGTNRTVDSSAYSHELAHVNPRTKLFAKATPLLVPMIEAGNIEKIDEVLRHYLEQFKKQKIKTLILGCTHYCLLKNKAKKILGTGVQVVSQDDLLPNKLKVYLIKHKEISKKLSRGGKVEYLITKVSHNYKEKFKIIKY